MADFTHFTLVGATNLPVDIRMFGAQSGGTFDCSKAFRLAIAQAIATDGTLYIPAGTWKTTEVIRWNDSYPRIVGAGIGKAIIQPAATTYHAVHAGTGSEGPWPGGGYVYGFSVVGASNNPTKTSKAGVLIDGVHGCQVGPFSVEKHDIGVDFKDNCYGSWGIGIQAPFGTCNVGINLRTGTQSGSDIPFYNCWVVGGVAGVHIAGGSGGFHFYGGQTSVGQTVGPTPIAAVVGGKDYEATTLADGGLVSFHGVDFEGWHIGYAIRTYAGMSMQFDNCSFLATSTGSGRVAAGLLYIGSPANTHFTFRGCGYSGTYTDATLVTQAGSFGDGHTVIEEGWTSGSPFTINGVGSQYVYSLMDQFYSVNAPDNGRGISMFGLAGVKQVIRMGGGGIIYGKGSPESSVAARVGNIYLREDGGAGTTLYVKQSGTGNTGWVGK